MCHEKYGALQAPPVTAATSRTQRACDQCRQRKARCDGLGTPDKRCTPCATASRSCTYTNFKRKSNPKQKASPEYVEELEKTIEKMREMLMAAAPGIDILSDIGRSESSTPSSPPILSKKDFITACLNHISGRLEFETHSDEDDVYISPDGAQDMIFGRSSAADLALELASIKNKHRSSPVPFYTNTDTVIPDPDIWLPTQAMVNPVTPDQFPNTETLISLTKCYFDNVNIFWPFLHQPTIEKMISERLYLVDPAAGTMILLIACIASRYSDDYQRYWNIADPKKSVVWEWFYLSHQLRKVSLKAFTNITLPELQIHLLNTLFLSEYQYGHMGWVMAGFGLRLVQCSGAERKQKQSQMPLVEGEFYKRAIWSLSSMDAYWSAGLGRLPMNKTSDLGPAIECDDEYVVRPEQGSNPFQQPKEKPSKIAYFNRMTILMQLLSFVLNAIYPMKKFKNLFGTDELDVDQHIVRELDSAMNRWLEETPPHLRWDPNNEDDTFFVQSAVLHCTFYFVQILIHRPFIPHNGKPSTLPLPSLAICLNAARASCRIGEEHLKRKGCSIPDIHFPIFISGLILLTSSFSKKHKDGPIVLSDKELVDVYRCLAVIDSSGHRWSGTRRMRVRNTLKELISANPDSEVNPLAGTLLQHHAQDQPPSTSTETPPYDMGGVLSNGWGDSPEGWSSLFNAFGDYPASPSNGINAGEIPPFLSDSFPFDPMPTYMAQELPFNSWFSNPMAGHSQGFYNGTSGSGQPPHGHSSSM